jgi:hypothetical protein
MATPLGDGYCTTKKALAPNEDKTVTLRCILDGLLLPAVLCVELSALIVYDGVEAFELEAVEALYYEVVEASANELVGLQGPRYRMLRRAADFDLLEC